MYPAELEIEDTTYAYASYLDLLLSIGRNGQRHTFIYYKEMFTISTSQTFRSWVVIFHLRRFVAFFSQLIRYARTCSSYECFILRTRWLSSKLLKQGYLVKRLKSAFRKLYGRYGDLIQQFEVSVPRMLNDILTLDMLQWLPNRYEFPPILWPGHRAWL